MTIDVRKAEVSDAQMIALLGRITFRETFGHLFEQHEDELRDYLNRTFSVDKIGSSIAKPENNYWIAHFDGLPVGYAKLKHPSLSGFIDDKSSAQLQKIYVLSEFLTHRIGQALLSTVSLHSTESGARSMWLTVLKSNERAIRFYERNGWSGIADESFSIGSQDFPFRVFARSNLVN